MQENTDHSMECFLLNVGGPALHPLYRDPSNYDNDSAMGDKKKITTL